MSFFALSFRSRRFDRIQRRSSTPLDSSLVRHEHSAHALLSPPSAGMQPLEEDLCARREGENEHGKRGVEEFSLRAQWKKCIAKRKGIASAATKRKNFQIGNARHAVHRPVRAAPFSANQQAPSQRHARGTGKGQITQHKGSRQFRFFHRPPSSIRLCSLSLSPQVPLPID